MPLDLEYLHYCSAGVPFYVPVEASGRSPRLDDGLAVPPGWTVRRETPWTMWWLESSHLPRQGWKIHLSATRDNSRRVLRFAAAYCIQEGIPFKYLATEADLAAQNSKYADRSSAGKFVTIYPKDLTQFRAALTALDDMLEGEQGPFILSDRRWRAAPVFYRFGAFWPAPQNSDYISSLLAPDGREVEDIRRPAFTPPDWVTVPDFLMAPLPTPKDSKFPFEMKSALHFSNGGGVYLASALTDQFVPQGTNIILKEARPHAGVDSQGNDAVARLHHEARVLAELEPTGHVPKCYGIFRAWEHSYAVLEHIEGLDLTRTWMLRTPVLTTYPWRPHNSEYLTWLTLIIERLDEVLATFHAAGWLIGDIHPKNVIITDDDTPKFLDFEFAHTMSTTWRSVQGAPGYEPPSSLTGVAADQWSLGIMELGLILPQAMIVDQGNDQKIDEIIACGERDLSIPPEVGARIRAKTTELLAAHRRHAKPARALSTTELSAALAAGLLDCIDFDGDGPVIPSDIAVYGKDGPQARLGYPYGLVGALGVLNASGHMAPSEVLSRASDWIALHLDAIHSRGFAGKDGIEFGLRQAGLDALANDVQVLKVDWPNDHSYWSGWSGVGLHALQDPRHSPTEVEEAADALRELVESNSETRHEAGLLYGWSAAAIFWALAFRIHDQRPEYLSLARRAIELDLAQCGETSKGTKELDEGWRTLPYLGTGSIAIALAIRELSATSGRQEFSSHLDQIHRAATYKQYAQAGFAHGVSGFIPYLARCIDGHGSDTSAVISSHIEALQLHALKWGNGLLIRGNQGLRLSCDFLTGAAGAVGALASVEGRWSGIPFLPGTVRNRLERR